MKPYVSRSLSLKQAEFCLNFSSGFPYVCNFPMGPPPLTAQIRSSVLGKGDGPVACRRVLTLGLNFLDLPPVDTMKSLLYKGGYTTPDELRDQYNLPEGRLLCRVATRGRRLNVTTASRALVLEQALLLGLCTSVMFDPGRPVIWTAASLTRHLELYDPAGFYL